MRLGKYFLREAAKKVFIFSGPATKRGGEVRPYVAGPLKKITFFCGFPDCRTKKFIQELRYNFQSFAQRTKDKMPLTPKIALEIEVFGMKDVCSLSKKITEKNMRSISTLEGIEI